MDDMNAFEEAVAGNGTATPHASANTLLAFMEELLDHALEAGGGAGAQTGDQATATLVTVVALRAALTALEQLPEEGHEGEDFAVMERAVSHLLSSEWYQLPKYTTKKNLLLFLRQALEAVYQSEIEE